MLEIVEVPEDAPEMEFEFLIGDVNWETYGGKWISKDSFHHGDFEYWLVIEFINFCDGDPELYVEIAAVSPEAAAEKLEAAVDSVGLPENYEIDHRIEVEALSCYGISATLWHEITELTEEEANWEDYEDKAEALLKKARQVAPVVIGLFGFFMDAPQNAIGATGWDFIQGDIMAGL